MLFLIPLGCSPFLNKSVYRGSGYAMILVEKEKNTFSSTHKVMFLTSGIGRPVGENEEQKYVLISTFQWIAEPLHIHYK